MKKIIALLLVAVMAVGMVACSSSEETKGGNDAATTTAAKAEAPASALEVLENIWALYGEDEKFFAMGGDYNAPTDNKPGAVDLGTTDFLLYNLLVPEAELVNLTEAASLVHAMNANTFTAGSYCVASDVNEFATAMQTAIQGNQWLCGFPETLVIASFGDGYVLVAYGMNDAMTPFQAKLAEAYPAAEILVNEAITG